MLHRQPACLLYYAGADVIPTITVLPYRHRPFFLPAIAAYLVLFFSDFNRLAHQSRMENRKNGSVLRSKTQLNPDRQLTVPHGNLGSL